MASGPGGESVFRFTPARLPPVFFPSPIPFPLSRFGDSCYAARTMRRRLTIPEKAVILLTDLLSSRLEVAKWPGRFGEGYVRGCISVNTEWYRKFCAQYPRRWSRKYPKPGRTNIKRQHTIAALKRIQAGEHHGIYAGRLLEFIHNWSGDWHVSYQAKRQPVDSREF